MGLSVGFRQVEATRRHVLSAIPEMGSAPVYCGKSLISLHHCGDLDSRTITVETVSPLNSTLLTFTDIPRLTTLAAVVLDYMGLYCEAAWGPGWGHVYVSYSVTRVADYSPFEIDTGHSLALGHYCDVLPDPALRRCVKRTCSACCSSQAIFHQGSR